MKRMLVVTFMAALGAIAISMQGCGGGGGGGGGGSDAGPTGSMTVEQTCAQVVAELSAKQATCQGVAPEFVAAVTATDTTCAEMSKSVAAGRAKFDASKAQACIDSVKNSSCADLANGVMDAPNSACNQAVAGQVANGGNCFSGNDCSPGSFCDKSNNQCPGKCTAKVAINGDCSAGQSCVVGSSCIFNSAGSAAKCVSNVGANQPCGSSVADCQGGLSCQGASGSRTCQAPPTSGSCKFGTCAPGFACPGAGIMGGQGTCTPAKAVGAACTVGQNECILGSTCVGGTCKIAKVGDACGVIGSGNSGEFALCAEGWCNWNPGAGQFAGTCQPLKAVGADCGGSEECAGGGSCDPNTGKCVAACLAP